MHLLWLIVFGRVVGQHLTPAVSSPHQPAKVTQLHLRTSSLGETQSFWLTTDSIGVEKLLRTEGGMQHRRFARAITPQHYRWLVAPFTQQVVATLKPVYDNPLAGDDASAFTLVIYEERVAKSIRVYGCRLASLVAFTKRLNRVVSKAFRVPYP